MARPSGARSGANLRSSARRLNAEGLRFGWHNHHWEYGKAADGRTFLELIFAEAAGPALASRSRLDRPRRRRSRRGDPKHAGRVEACHVKDMAPAGECLDEDGWADPGHGVLDWKASVGTHEEDRRQYFVAEHDKPNDVARFARRALKFAATWG